MTRIDHYHVANAPRATTIVPAASAILLDGSGNIILQQRRDNGLWALPGGGMEVGETISQTVLREIKEETGFDAKIDRLVGIYSDPEHVIEFSDGEVRQQFSICFSCTITGGSISVSDESIKVAAFAFDDLPGLKIHEAIRIRINDYLSDRAQPILR